MATSKKPKLQTTSSNFQEIGETGVKNFSGIIYDEEQNNSLASGKWIETANRMYREEVSVKAAFYLAVLPVLLANWNFGYPDDGVGDPEVLDFCNKIFENSEETWHEMLQRIVFYPLWGHFPFEKVFKVEDDLFWLKKLAPRKPNDNSRFIVDKNGKLVIYKQWAQNAPDGGWGWHDIPAEKLVLFVNDNIFGSNYEGISGLRAAYRPYVIKNQLVESDKFRHYRFSSPIPVFEEPEDEPAKNDDIREENRDLVKQMGQKLRSGRHNYVIIPNGWSFRLVQPDAGTNTTLQSIKYHDNQIFSSVLANLVGMGTTGGATQGLGDTMSSMAAMGPTNIAKYIGEKITSDIIKPLVDMNFGPQDNYPQFFASNVRQSTIADVLPFITSAVQGGGLTRDLSIENYLRDLIGVRKITKEEFGEMNAEEKRSRRRSMRETLNPRESSQSTQAQPASDAEGEDQ